MVKDLAVSKGFWSYKASGETPTLEAAIEIGAIPKDTTLQQWEALSPGMRREIVRSKELFIPIGPRDRDRKRFP